jgi:hypothetical protein
VHYPIDFFFLCAHLLFRLLSYIAGSFCPLMALLHPLLLFLKTFPLNSIYFFYVITVECTTCAFVHVSTFDAFAGQSNASHSPAQFMLISLARQVASTSYCGLQPPPKVAASCLFGKFLGKNK